MEDDGLVTLVGGMVAVIGLSFDSVAMTTVGVTAAILSVLGFLVPGLRDVRTPQRVDWSACGAQGSGVVGRGERRRLVASFVFCRAAGAAPFRI